MWNFCDLIFWFSDNVALVDYFAFIENEYNFEFKCTYGHIEWYIPLSSKVYSHTSSGLLFSLNYPHRHSPVEASPPSKQHTGRSLQGAGQHSADPLMAYSSLEMSTYSFPSDYAPYWWRKVCIPQTLPGSILSPYIKLDKSLNFHSGVQFSQY